MSLCIGGNISVMCFCSIWLLIHFWDLSVWSSLAAVLIGFFLADVLSGLVHWATDTWFHDGVIFGRWFAIAREHHTHPENIFGYCFYEHATVGSAASAFLIGPIAALTALLPPTSLVAESMCIYLVICVCGLFGTSLHNLGHRNSGPGLVRFLQRWHLLMCVDHHQEHHRGDHTMRYCTVNGWANWLLDGLKVWRGLEHIIHRATGAIPRENDRAWRRRFEGVGTTVGSPRSPVSRAEISRASDVPLHDDCCV